MSGVVVLPPDAWQAEGALAQARFTAPGEGRIAIWAEGADAAPRLHRADGREQDFAVLGDCAFAACDAVAGEALRITAPAPARRCLVLLRAAGGPSPSLAAGWPRALARPARRAAPELPATRARMDAALAEGALDAALAALAEMLVLARDDAATTEAAAALLRHLARHPMLRGPALGALAAALTEVPA
jgi:hypothetical protein